MDPVKSKKSNTPADSSKTNRTSNGMQAKKVRVAVIGAGNMGRHHIRNYAVLPEADLVAISDINPDSKKLAKEYKMTYYPDYKKMLDTEKPDAVSIVVPTPLH